MQESEGHGETRPMPALRLSRGAGWSSSVYLKGSQGLVGQAPILTYVHGTLDFTRTLELNSPVMSCLPFVWKWIKLEWWWKHFLEAESDFGDLPDLSWLNYWAGGQFPKAVLEVFLLAFDTLWQLGLLYSIAWSDWKPPEDEIRWSLWRGGPLVVDAGSTQPWRIEHDAVQLRWAQCSANKRFSADQPIDTHSVLEPVKGQLTLTQGRRLQQMRNLSCSFGVLIKTKHKRIHTGGVGDTCSMDIGHSYRRFLSG